jgi:hypothetical protein
LAKIASSTRGLLEANIHVRSSKQGLRRWRDVLYRSGVTISDAERKQFVSEECCRVCVSRLGRWLLVVSYGSIEKETKVKGKE